MKSILLSLTLLWPPALWAQSFLHLTVGESYSYEFSTVPFTQAGTMLSQRGVGIFYLTSTDLDPASQVKVEMFEGRLGEILLETHVANTENGVWVGVPGAWQDLEGSMRLTVLTGAVDLTGIGVVVVAGGPGPLFDSNLYGYNQIIPVPEPSTWSLFGAGLLAVGTWTMLRRRRDTAA
jgi:PEP-CTERM motif